MPVGTKPKRRQCEFKRCCRPLPKAASLRRRYCGPNCVAGAYRLRVRRERAWNLMSVTIGATAADLLRTNTREQDDLLARQTCQGPAYHTALWAGARRRSNTRYCGARCRQAAYRARQRDRVRTPQPTAVSGDHDTVP